jgi:hypothetical protein
LPWEAERRRLKRASGNFRGALIEKIKDTNKIVDDRARSQTRFDLIPSVAYGLEMLHDDDEVRPQDVFALYKFVVQTVGESLREHRQQASSELVAAGLFAITEYPNLIADESNLEVVTNIFKWMERAAGRDGSRRTISASIRAVALSLIGLNRFSDGLEREPKLRAAVAEHGGLRKSRVKDLIVVMANSISSYRFPNGGWPEFMGGQKICHRTTDLAIRALVYTVKSKSGVGQFENLREIVKSDALRFVKDRELPNRLKNDPGAAASVLNTLLANLDLNRSPIEQGYYTTTLELLTIMERSWDEDAGLYIQPRHSGPAIDVSSAYSIIRALKEYMRPELLYLRGRVEEAARLASSRLIKSIELDADVLKINLIRGNGAPCRVEIDLANAPAQAAIISALLANPHGMTAAELAQQFGKKANSASANIMHLRNKINDAFKKMSLEFTGKDVLVNDDKRRYRFDI